MSISKKIHMKMSVRGALRKANRELNGVLMRGGTALSGAEVREALMQCLADGQECLPLCDPDDCPDFDYSGSGCPGHEADASDHPSPFESALTETGHNEVSA